MGSAQSACLRFVFITHFDRSIVDSQTCLVQRDGPLVTLRPETMMIITSGATIKMGFLEFCFELPPRAIKADPYNGPEASGISCLCPSVLSMHDIHI